MASPSRYIWHLEYCDTELILNFNKSMLARGRTVADRLIAHILSMKFRISSRGIYFYRKKITKKSSQIYRKTIENWALGLPWDSFWSHFGASWEASWTHAPKRLDFKVFGMGLGSPRQPTWLQLGGQKAPRSRPQPQKTDDEKQHVFCIDF